MAFTTVTGPNGDPYGIQVPPRSKSYTGAGATWASGNDLLISPACRAVRCGTGGNLHVRYLDGSVEDTIPSLLDGETFEGRINAVYADSTVQNITIIW